MKQLLIIGLLLFSISASAQISSSTIDSIANEEPFKKKVRFAALSVAETMADTSSGKPLRYAQLILISPVDGAWLEPLCYGVARANVTKANSDASFTSAVRSLFLRYAYAFYRDLSQ